MRRSSAALCALLFSGASLTAAEQETTTAATVPAPAAGQAPGAAAGAGPNANAWSVSLDGVAFGTFNHQGERRGATEFRSQNWLMAMASRRLGAGAFSSTAMVTAEPLTSPGMGYAQLFQAGEAYRGLQITDHQHPHDLFMQLAASWRVPLGDRTSLTIAGGPVGEPALGPVPFMHRTSSMENPSAALAHHIFDSTHIASSVVLGRLDRGIVSVEGSVFRGRESDEHRYDLDLGTPDSWSVRGWLRPRPDWLIQASHGFLKEPEILEPGNQRRTNASASWTRRRASGLTAVTAAVGRNRRPYSVLDSVLVEGTHKAGRSSVYARFERTEVETEILLFPQIVHVPHPGELVDTVRALTAGSVRDVATVRGVAIGLGGDVSVYGVPPLLRNTHGERPVSFHLFVRISRSDLTRRMLDVTMGQHAAGPDHRHH